MRKMKRIFKIAAATMLSMTLLLPGTNVLANAPDGEGITLLSGEVNEQVVTNPRLRGILTNGVVTNNVNGGYESQRVKLSAAYSKYINITYQNNLAKSAVITLYKSDTPLKGDPGTAITDWVVYGNGTTTERETISDADRNKYLYIHIVPTGMETSVDGVFNWIQE